MSFGVRVLMHLVEQTRWEFVMFEPSNDDAAIASFIGAMRGAEWVP
jgi:hypothetical protein